MYEGHNADLRLPTEPNVYWARLWAGLGATGNAGSTPAVVAGPAGASLGGAIGGGEH